MDYVKVATEIRDRDLRGQSVALSMVTAEDIVDDAEDVPKTKIEEPHVLHLYHQLDYLIIFASLAAIIIGILGILDAKAVRTNNEIDAETHANSTETDDPSDLHKKPVLRRVSTDFPLIIFGIATAIAWTAAQRAIFKATSLDANKCFASGIKQKDFANILELSMPSKGSLVWRKKLWKSTGFALLQLLLYVGAALSYRRAFKQQGDKITVDMTQMPTQFQLGCHHKDFWTTYANLLGADNNYGPWNRYATQILIDGPVSLYDSRSPNGWLTTNAWHGSLFYRVIPDTSRLPDGGITVKDFTGPAIGGLIRQTLVVDIAANSTYPRVAVDVVQDSNCGTMPQLCLTSNHTDRANYRACFRLGLAVQRYSMNVTSIGSIGGSSLLNDSSLPSFASPEYCPLQLSSNVYRSWFERTINAIEFDVETSVNLVVFCALNKKALTNAFAALIAEVQAAHVRDILDINLLREQGMYVTSNTDQTVYANACDHPEIADEAQRNKAESGLPIYAGSLKYPILTNEWVVYQLAASVLIIVWGLCLATMAYPYRNFVIKGQLHQYMSFGADLGPREMAGASTGHWSAASTKLWRLRQQRNDDDEYGLRLVDAGLARTSSDGIYRLRYGAEYV